MSLTRDCPSCGVANRVPPERLADIGRCGSCRAELAPLDRPLEADPQLFETLRERATVPILVDFWAAWCGPCRAAAPEVEKVAANMAGRALVVKIDTQRHPELAERHGVRGIPSFMVLRAGRVLMQQAGLVGHARMEEWLASAGA